MSDHDAARNFWRSVVQIVSGAIALAILTAFAFRLHVNLATAVCLYLIVIVLLSLRGGFVSSTVLSVIAVGCLAYYFAPPIFSFRVSDEFEGVAIVLFLTTSIIIVALVSMYRARTAQLVLTNVELEQQIAERQQTQESLQQAQANLARVNRVMLVGELTASIAHEVNQPLTGIVANGGTALRYLAAQPADLDEARKFLGLIVRDGKRWLDINEAIIEVIALADDELRRNPVELRIQLANGLHPVPADRVQLQQVILNLIVNAIELNGYRLRGAPSVPEVSRE